MTVAYIAIGGDLASPLEQVNAALKALGDIPRKPHSCRFLVSPTAGAAENQPDYLNAAVALETSLARKSYSTIHSASELQQGRLRKAERWGPRTLDLDIMLLVMK
ncbi:2-amino-4-hydroxy-6-hydroxymethyldihydropteridine diphosphokinase [Shigella flexneri]